MGDIPLTLCLVKCITDVCPDGVRFYYSSCKTERGWFEPDGTLIVIYPGHGETVIRDWLYDHGELDSDIRPCPRSRHYYLGGRYTIDDQVYDTHNGSPGMEVLSTPPFRLTEDAVNQIMYVFEGCEDLGVINSKTKYCLPFGPRQLNGLPVS